MLHGQPGITGICRPEQLQQHTVAGRCSWQQRRGSERLSEHGSSRAGACRHKSTANTASGAAEAGPGA